MLLKIQERKNLDSKPAARTIFLLVCLTPRRKANCYTISYWTEGRRKREVFKTLQAAKDVAALKENQMTQGDLGAAKLTDVECTAYLRASSLLEPVGVPLELAASEYASAAKRLGVLSLSQAVDFFLLPGLGQSETAKLL